jgi:hypothetical protein
VYLTPLFYFIFYVKVFNRFEECTWKMSWF